MAERKNGSGSSGGKSAGEGPSGGRRKQADPAAKAGEGKEMRASGGPRADQSAAAGSATRKPRTSETNGEERASGRSTGSRSRNLQKELRDFAAARPQGWGHDDWLNFLEDLKERGHNIQDREAIGAALEKERLDVALSQVKGVGPQRRQALIERYENVWNLRNADPSEISSAGGMPMGLAEQVKEQMR